MIEEILADHIILQFPLSTSGRFSRSLQICQIVPSQDPGDLYQLVFRWNSFNPTFDSCVDSPLGFALILASYCLLYLLQTFYRSEVFVRRESRTLTCDIVWLPCRPFPLVLLPSSSTSQIRRRLVVDRLESTLRRSSDLLHHVWNLASASSTTFLITPSSFGFNVSSFFGSLPTHQEISKFRLLKLPIPRPRSYQSNGLQTHSSPCWSWPRPRPRHPAVLQGLPRWRLFSLSIVMLSGQETTGQPPALFLSNCTPHTTEILLSPATNFELGRETCPGKLQNALSLMTSVYQSHASTGHISPRLVEVTRTHHGFHVRCPYIWRTILWYLESWRHDLVWSSLSNANHLTNDL